MFCRGELGLHPTHALAKVLVSAIAGNLGRCAQVRPVVPVILLAPGAEAAIGILTRLALPEFGFHMRPFLPCSPPIYLYRGAAFMHRRCLDSEDFPGISGVYFQRSVLSKSDAKNLSVRTVMCLILPKIHDPWFISGLVMPPPQPRCDYTLVEFGTFKHRFRGFLAFISLLVMPPPQPRPRPRGCQPRCAPTARQTRQPRCDYTARRAWHN